MARCATVIQGAACLVRFTADAAEIAAPARSPAGSLIRRRQEKAVIS